MTLPRKKQSHLWIFHQKGRVQNNICQIGGWGDEYVLDLMFFLFLFTLSHCTLTFQASDCFWKPVRISHRPSKLSKRDCLECPRVFSSERCIFCFFFFLNSVISNHWYGVNDRWTRQTNNYQEFIHLHPCSIPMVVLPGEHKKISFCPQPAPPPSLNTPHFGFISSLVPPSCDLYPLLEPQLLTTDVKFAASDLSQTLIPRRWK